MKTSSTLLLFLLLTLPSHPQTTSDLLIYGATPAGITAALTAANQNYTVTLIGPSTVPGGMITGGLSATDIAIKNAIGGLAAQLFKDIGAHYGTNALNRFEPHIALKVFTTWLNHKNITLHLNQHITAVHNPAGQILHITTSDNKQHHAKQYIDASYQGDLMALSGVSFTYGRESISTYNESYAGVQNDVLEKQFTIQVNPFDHNGKLLPEIQPQPMADLGQGDSRIQAYNYRLCLTDIQDKLIPFYKPPKYDPWRYELLARYLSQLPNYRLEHTLMFLPIHQANKIDLNHAGPFSTDYIGGNWDYPTATHQQRKKIEQAHRHYTEGLLYFLSTDLRIPEQIRLPLARYGYAKDEFTQTQNWPHQLYIREARRMLGAYILTQQDILENITKPDSIGLGSHRIESHPTQRIVRFNTFAYNKGDVQVRVKMTPYQIPYRAITPLQNQCTNLLVPVCISASHIAYSSIRMEPQYMIMGQSAAQAALLAIQTQRPVQTIDIPTLQNRLIAAKQHLHWP